MELLQKIKKSLGQNFLTDNNIINKILLKPKKFYAVEKDKNLAFFLENKFKSNKNVKILNEDILDTIHNYNLENDIIIFGNLPYNISTKILTSLVMLKKWPPWYDSLIFMFQKEVADRITAKTNTKNFSRLSVISNWRFDIKKHFDVSKNCFFPKPKVNSTVLSFKPKKINLFKLKDPKNLEKITRVLFSNRRKMINKSFNKLFKGRMNNLNDLQINLNMRPGEISSTTYYKIAVLYEKLFY